MSSSTLRLFSRNIRVIPHVSRPALSPLARPFYSPFAVLGDSPLTSPSPPSMGYEKQLEHSPEPVGVQSGSRTYVVSQPDASDKHYEVPSGAYPTSAPYINFPRADASIPKSQVSSTNSTVSACEQTTRSSPSLRRRRRERGHSPPGGPRRALGAGRRIWGVGAHGLQNSNQQLTETHRPIAKLQKCIQSIE